MHVLFAGCVIHIHCNLSQASGFRMPSFPSKKTMKNDQLLLSGHLKSLDIVTDFADKLLV